MPYDQLGLEKKCLGGDGFAEINPGDEGLRRDVSRE